MTLSIRKQVFFFKNQLISIIFLEIEIFESSIDEIFTKSIHFENFLLIYITSKYYLIFLGFDFPESVLLTRLGIISKNYGIRTLFSIVCEPLIGTGFRALY